MRYYYVFKGQKATIGAPHPQTGNRNIYGELIAFTTRAKRETYYDEYYRRPSEFVQKCNKKTARQFFLGVSVAVYGDCVREANLDADAEYNDYFEK